MICDQSHNTVRRKTDSQRYYDIKALAVQGKKKKDLRKSPPQSFSAEGFSYRHKDGGGM